jgi:hypothetical protein
MEEISKFFYRYCRILGRDLNPRSFEFKTVFLNSQQWISFSDTRKKIAVCSENKTSAMFYFIVMFWCETNYHQLRRQETHLPVPNTFKTAVLRTVKQHRRLCTQVYGLRRNTRRIKISKYLASRNESTRWERNHRHLMFPTKLHQDEMQALMLTEPTNIPLMYIYICRFSQILVKYYFTQIYKTQFKTLKLCHVWRCGRWKTRTEFLALEDGTDRLSWNVGKDLPLLAA